MDTARLAAGSLGPRLAGRLTAELILRSPQYMNCVKQYEIDLRGAHHARPGGRGSGMSAQGLLVGQRQTSELPGGAWHALLLHLAAAHAGPVPTPAPAAAWHRRFTVR